MADITTIALAHARCLDCRWMGEGFLTTGEALDDAHMWHVERCPGPVQANADDYTEVPTSGEGE